MLGAFSPDAADLTADASGFDALNGTAKVLPRSVQLYAALLSHTLSSFLHRLFLASRIEPSIPTRPKDRPLTG